MDKRSDVEKSRDLIGQMREEAELERRTARKPPEVDIAERLAKLRGVEAVPTDPVPGNR